MGYWELQQERERRLKELLEVYRENWFKHLELQKKTYGMLGLRSWSRK